MKKQVSVLITVLLIALMAIPVAALGSPTGQANQPNASIRQAEKSLNAEMRAERAVVEQLRNKIRQNRLKNESLRLQNRNLRLNLRQILLNVKKELPAASILQLKAYHLELKTLTEQLADTKGDIREILATVRSKIEQKDWQAVKLAYQNIIAIQEARAAKLTQINEKLKQMIALVKPTI
jgi:hypothetical protein